MTLIEILKKEMVGKKLKHFNNYSREVELEIEDVVFSTHTIELEPATAANDWWPATSESSTFMIKFIDGSSIEISPNKDFLLNL